MNFERFRVRASLAFHRLFLPRALRHLLRQGHPYDIWQKTNILTPVARSDLTDALAAHKDSLPLISVVMPVYRPDIGHFRAAIASVQEQIYQNWQLCICDDGSGDDDLRQEVNRIGKDSRVTFTFLSKNSGIGSATNAAASLACGDVILFLDQDDVLSADCLAEFALAFATDPDVELAYSDSDKIDAAGRRFDPSFKPGWSPTLLLSYMYLSHAVAMRRSVFERLGGVRSAYDGSQDFDLALRASEIVRAVRHIPRILYHWRVLPGSTALSATEKPTSIMAGQRAVEDVVARRALPARVERPDWAERANIGLFHLVFRSPTVAVSIIVMLDRGREDWRSHVMGLLGDAPSDAQIIVVASRRSTASMGLDVKDHAKIDGDVQLVFSDHEALSDRMAEAVAHASGDLILVLSGELICIRQHWIAQLCGYAGLPGVGAVGARLVDGQGRLVQAGLVAPTGEYWLEPAFAGLGKGRAGALYLARTSRECSAVTAHCLAISRDMLNRIGGIPSGQDGMVAVGMALSHAVRAEGASVILCADCEFRLDENSASRMAFAAPDTAPESMPDPWYNYNLGYGRNQYSPIRRRHPLRRRGPVKLAVVTHNLDGEGSQSTLLDLVRGLRDAGYIDPFIISQREGELGPAFRSEGIDVEVIASPGRRAGGAVLARYRHSLVEAYARHGAEAVLANTLESHAAIAAAAEAGLGALWWQHEGGDWWRYFRHLSVPVRAQAYAAFSQAYRVIQVADATRRAWMPLALQSNFQLIRNGIPTHRLEEDRDRWTRGAARRELGLDDHDCCVLLLGSIAPRKGQADILKALVRLGSNIPLNLKILIAGGFVDSAYRKKLECLHREMPKYLRDKILFLGRVDDTSKYYAASDIFLCCSRQESAPRTLVEAMNFSLPIITTPVDGIPELVVSGKTAEFYRPGDYSALSDMLMEFHASPHKREQLGRAGKRHVSNVSDFDVMVARFGTLVREAAALRTGR